MPAPTTGISGPPRFTNRSATQVFLRALGLALCMLCVTSASSQTPSASAKCPPATRTDGASDTYGSTVVADPYRWLEDQNSPETRAWIAAQQKCTEAALSNLPGRAEIARRLGELLHTDSFEVPTERGGRYFFRKRAAGQELYVVYMRRGLTGSDEVLIDPLPWSADHSASVILQNVSHDGKFVYFGRRDGGQDETTLRVMEVDTKRVLPDAFPTALYFAVEPTPDNRALYYVRLTSAGPRVFFHHMGDDPAKDAVIFGKDLGNDKILSAELSEDGTYLVYFVSYGSASEKTEIYVQNVRDNGPIVTAVNDEKALFFPTLAGSRLLLLSNSKAPQWHVYSTELATPQKEHWREIVPEESTHLEGIAPSGGKLVALYTRNASSELKLLDGNGKFESSIALPGLGSISGTYGRWESPEFFYSFESYNSVPQILRYDVSQAKSELWARDKVDLDAAAFEVEQVWYNSKDNTRVPMFLFHKKGLKLNGSNPVLLTGYGGFDVSVLPSFDSYAVVFVEHGGILATANLRGGGEFGEDWHRAGMLDKKQNVFDDFFAAAEFLIANNYTSPSRLSIQGASNGGLLVGAAMTQRPDLFQAVVCAYPLLDMLRFQKFLRGSYWVPEYGSADSPDQFSYLYQYSPYQHVRAATNYPATLFVTGDGDTRVAPLHARKMAALVQASSRSDRPVLLLYDTKSGHSGGRPVNKIIEEDTDLLSFLFWQLHMSAEKPLDKQGPGI
jgi:prolyl oligopeptidase